MRIRKRQVYNDRRVIRNPVGHGIVQLAHGYGEVRSEFKPHSSATRLRDERLHQEPVQLVAAHQSAKVPHQCKRRLQSLAGPLVAIRQSSPFLVQVAFRLAAKIESLVIGETKPLHMSEKDRLPVLTQDSQGSQMARKLTPSTEDQIWCISGLSKGTALDFDLHGGLMKILLRSYFSLWLAG